MRLRLLTLCAISAAKLLLCIRRRSTSRTLLTRNFFRPFGRRCLVWNSKRPSFNTQMEELQNDSHLLVAAVPNLWEVKIEHWALLSHSQEWHVPWASGAAP